MIKQGQRLAMLKSAGLALCLMFSATDLSSQPDEEFENGIVVNAVWGGRFAAPSYDILDSHPLRGEANFVAAGTWEQDGCTLNVSMFAEMIAAGSHATVCRAGFDGNPIPLETDSTITDLEVVDDPVAWTGFSRRLEDGLLQNQMYGYWTRGESCFELHLSSINCSSFGDIASQVVDSVQFDPRPGVNTETVAVGRAMGMKPDNWRVHEALGGGYLHNVRPPNLDRSRAYYENALKLSGDNLDTLDEWRILAGVCLSWLHEDNGRAAITPLTTAVELARLVPSAEALEETLYNLACAYSLSGDLESACKSIEELMADRSKKKQKQLRKEIRADSQLRAVSDSDCMRAH